MLRSESSPESKSACAGTAEERMGEETRPAGSGCGPPDKKQSVADGPVQAEIPLEPRDVHGFVLDSLWRGVRDWLCRGDSGARNGTLHRYSAQGSSGGHAGVPSRAWRLRPVASPRGYSGNARCRQSRRAVGRTSRRHCLRGRVVQDRPRRLGCAGERNSLVEYSEPNSHLGPGWRTGGKRAFQNRKICAPGVLPRLVGGYEQRPFLSGCRRRDLPIVHQGFAADAQPEDCRLLYFRFDRPQCALPGSESRICKTVAKFAVLARVRTLPAIVFLRWAISSNLSQVEASIIECHAKCS